MLTSLCANTILLGTLSRTALHRSISDGNVCMLQSFSFCCQTCWFNSSSTTAYHFDTLRHSSTRMFSDEGGYISATRCNSRSDRAICFDVSGSRRSSCVSVTESRYSSKRPLPKVANCCGPTAVLIWERRANHSSSCCLSTTCSHPMPYTRSNRRGLLGASTKNTALVILKYESVIIPFTDNYLGNGLLLCHGAAYSLQTNGKYTICPAR